MHECTHAEMTWILYPAQTIDDNSTDVKATQIHTHTYTHTDTDTDTDRHRHTHTQPDVQ